MPTQSKNAREYIGIRDFLKFMQEGQPEWALFAIKAPIEDVSSAFAEFRASKKRVVDVPRRGATDNMDVAFLTAVVQAKGNPWTVVFRSLTAVKATHLKRVPEEARTLSERLQTRAVTFFAEDTSVGMGYEIFEQGQSLERVDWEADELRRFESTLRPRPAQQQDDRDGFVDGLFRAEGIYVPCCYPQSDEQEEWLVVAEVSEEAVQRADVIDLGEVTSVGVTDGCITRRTSPVTIVLYFAFLSFAAWLVFRCFTLGWTVWRVVLLSIALQGFVICRGKWRTPGRVRKRDNSAPAVRDGDENDNVAT